MDDAGSQPWARVGRSAHQAPSRPLKTSVAIGFGSPAQDSGVTRLDLNDVLVRNPQATFLMRVAGDAMRGSGIGAGDLVLVDRAVEAQHGHVVIAIVEDAFVCRRLVREGGVPRLRGDGRGSGDDIVPRDGEELRVWGVVTTVVKSLPV
jgi:DNA polymerase V